MHICQHSRASSRSENLFENISQICVESLFLQSSHHWKMYMCLLRFSFQNSWRPTVNILVVFSLMEINNFSPQVSHLWLVRDERTPILLFWARLVIGRKRLGGPGWVRYTVIVSPIYRRILHICSHYLWENTVETQILGFLFIYKSYQGVHLSFCLFVV